MQQTLAQLVRAKYPGAYDDLSDQQLEQSVRAKFPGVYDDIPLSGAKPKPSEPRSSGLATLGDFVIGALKGGGETAINLGQMLHKIPGVSSLVDSLYGQEGLSNVAFDEARKVTQPTNTAQRIGKGVEQFAELMVPAAKVGQATRGLGVGARMLAEGVAGAGMNAAQGASPTAGAVVGALVPGVGAAYRGARGVLRGAGANPVVREAVDWGVSRGIPVDAATASGAPIVRAIQGAADATPLGGVVAAQARNQSERALQATGQQLAGAVDAMPQTATSAGEAIQGKLGELIKTASSEADSAYTKLRNIEANATGEIPLMGADKPSLSMVVDLFSAREQLKPVYERMLRSAQLAQPMGAEARALQAIDRLMRSEGQYASLSMVDDALSDLKGVLRSSPDKLGRGAGALNSVVASLDQQVMGAARRAGPEAVKALQDGRAATVRKYVAADLAERLGNEPAKVTGKVTARADTAIGLLRDLYKTAPAELPKVGRAVIDDLLETATQEGGFSRAQGLFAKWQNLGDETKRLLFKPETKEDLDKFFLLAKRMQESPNPSMSGTITMSGGSTYLMFMNPTTGVPLALGAGALSKLLHSQTGVKLVNRLMTTPPRSPQFQTLWQSVSRAAALEASQGGR